MRLLADENFPLPVVELLRSQGHDVQCAREGHTGLGDQALLELAESTGRLLFTLDRDFWQLALQRRTALKRSAVILFRVHPAKPENLTPLVDSALSAGREWIGHISIVTLLGIEMAPTGHR